MDQNADEPCDGPKSRVRRFEMETTLPRLGHRGRSPTEVMSVFANSNRVHPAANTDSRFHVGLRWAPAVMVGIATLLQIAVWNAPPDIRWDGTLSEWPIPWIVCCGSLTGFVAVVTAYLLGWMAFIALTFGSARHGLLVNLGSLLAFPVFIYAFMYWYYFG